MWIQSFKEDKDVSNPITCGSALVLIILIPNQLNFPYFHMSQKKLYISGEKVIIPSSQTPNPTPHMHPKIKEERINYRITVVGAKKHIYMEYVFIELSKTGAPVNSPLLYFVFYQCVYTFNFLYWVTAVQQFTENHRATIFVNYVCVPILHCAEAQIRLQRSKFSAASGRESLPHTRRRRQPLPEPSSPASLTTSCLTLQPRVSSTRTRVNYNELFYIFHQSPDPSPQGSSLGSRLTFVAQEPITGPRTLWVLSDRLLAKKKWMKMQA